MNPLPELRAVGAQYELAWCVEGLADRATLQQCLEQFDAWCAQRELSEADAMALRMCVDEVGSNVLMHAYVQEPPEPGAEPRAGRMRVELWVPAADAPAETLVALRVIDAGRAFDPHDAPIARMEDDVEERALGGLGWFFVREMTDRIDYQRTAHPCNVSTMWRVLGRRELEA